jgi:putative ABC transport system substrate-binding protein
MLFALSLSVQAQAVTKVVRIGILTSGSAARANRNLAPFWESLRELGYVAGKNIAIEYRHADGKRDRLPELATELVRTKVDVILVTGTRPVAAAKQATSTIPIIAGGAGDLVLNGIHPYFYGVERETNRAVKGSCFKSFARGCNLVYSAGPG